MKELTGTEKQIAWANDIREEMLRIYENALAAIDYEIDDEDNDEDTIEEFKSERAKLAAEFDEIISGQDSAAWWIDHRIAPPIKTGLSTVGYNDGCLYAIRSFLKRARRG